ncbi:putative 2OG-Fe(II) oxygenase [Elongatibacter sediminis]|uniref:2OG-Fe(II) oxygenase n=1 Tax=Elongatibacter sediminis TaxID=3119006 RepID=A0AAW9RI40_9GAMM
MEFTQDIEIHYPTTVMQRSFSDAAALNSRLYALLRALADRYEKTARNAVSSGQIATQGGYQTAASMNLFLLKEEAIRTFRDELVLPAVRDYLEHVFGDQARHFNPWPDGWANLLRRGDWQRPHFHPTHRNVVCGVYYVHLPGNLPEPQGNIEFFNPIQASVNHGFPSTRRLLPAEGKLILFPPWYVHYVHPFEGEGERCIIAFDVFAQRPARRVQGEDTSG